MIANDSGLELYAVSDVDASINALLTEKNLLKKDGTPYKGNEITDIEIRLSGATQSIKCKKVSGKGFDVAYIKPFTFTNSGQASISEFFGSIGNNTISISNKVGVGPFNISNDGVVSDSIGNKWSLNDADTPSQPLMDKFVSSLFSNGSQMLLPLIAKYGEIIRNIPTKSSVITGYASINTWLMQMGRGDMIPRLGTNASQAIQLSIPQGEIGVSVSESDGLAAFSLDGASLGIQQSTKPMPFVLISTAPMKVAGNKYPSTPISFRGRPFFAMPLIVNDPKIFTAMKGGVDLLR